MKPHEIFGAPRPHIPRPAKGGVVAVRFWLRLSCYWAAVRSLRLKIGSAALRLSSISCKVIYHLEASLPWLKVTLSIKTKVFEHVSIVKRGLFSWIKQT